MTNKVNIIQYEQNHTFYSQKKTFVINYINMFFLIKAILILLPFINGA